MRCNVIEADFLKRQILLEVCEGEEMVVSATEKELVEAEVVKALRFYADRRSYEAMCGDLVTSTRIVADGGRRARMILDGEELA